MALKEGKHGVIVVHGKAAKLERGEYIARITNSIADTLRESPVQVRTEEGSNYPTFNHPTIDIDAKIDTNAKTPAGVTLTVKAPIIPPWESGKKYRKGDCVVPRDNPAKKFKLKFKCIEPGHSGENDPEWLEGENGITYDGIVILKMWEPELWEDKDKGTVKSWEPEHKYSDINPIDYVIPAGPKEPVGFKLRFRCYKTGTSGDNEPIWFSKGYKTYDGSVEWIPELSHEIYSWQPDTKYEKGDCVIPKTNLEVKYQLKFKCIEPGRSGKNEPEWLGGEDGLTYDGIAPLKMWEPKLWNNINKGIVKSWQPDTHYNKGECVIPVGPEEPVGFKLRFRCNKTGTSTQVEPLWLEKGYITSDGPNIKWTPYENKATTWIFKEAFWNDAIAPPPAAQVLVSWRGVIKSYLQVIIQRLLDLVTPFWFRGKKLFQIWRDPANKKFRSGPYSKIEDKKPTKPPDIAEKNYITWRQNLTEDQYKDWQKKEWEKRKEEYYKREKKQNKTETGGAPNKGLIFGPITYLYLSILSIVFMIARIICFPLSIIILCIYLSPLFLVIEWILKLISSSNSLPDIKGWLSGIEKHVSESIGDVTRYLDHAVWSDVARGRLDEILIEMYKDTSIKDITIIAESTGAVLTYDALSEGSDAPVAINEFITKGGKEKKITLITVGNGINLIKSLPEPSNTFAQQQFYRRLDKVITGCDDPEVWRKKEPAQRKTLRDHFFWLDIYSRLDSVPNGDMKEKYLNQAMIDNEFQFKERMVVNLDDFGKDHNYYWENREIVVPRVIRSINSGEYPWNEIEAENKINSHYARLKKLQWSNLAIWVAIIIIVVLTGFFWGDSFWNSNPDNLGILNKVWKNIIKFKENAISPKIWGPILLVLILIGIPRFFRAKWFRGAGV